MLFNNNGNLDCDGRVNSGEHSSARCCAPKNGSTQAIVENPARRIIDGNQINMGTATIATGPNQNEGPLKHEQASGNKNHSDGGNKSLLSPTSLHHNTHHSKGVKRQRNEQAPSDYRQAMVLSSVSTNIANNNRDQQNQQSPEQTQQQPQQLIHHRYASGQSNKWPGQTCSAVSVTPARPLDIDQHQQSRPNCCSEATIKLPNDHNDDQANDNNRHAIMDNDEQYEYETVLAKILNEKKLALTSSPEVIRFLCNVKHQSGASTGQQRRVIM